MAVVCVKLDILDVKRISTIPLCGKDGSFKYEVTVVTGRQVGAGKAILHIKSQWISLRSGSVVGCLT